MLTKTSLKIIILLTILIFYLLFRMTSRPRTTSFVDSQKCNNTNFAGMKISSKDGSKVMTVIASPGQGPDRSTEVSYTDTKVQTKLS